MGDGGGQRVEGERCGLLALFNYVTYRVMATTIFTETANWEEEWWGTEGERTKD